MRELTTITIRLEPAMHKEFKKYAVDAETNMRAILVEYVKKMLEEQKAEKK